MSELIHNHYQKLAGIYEDLWFYSGDFVEFITNKIIEYLCLKNADILIDLGCGTGIYAKEINNQMQLYHPIICVDSSNKMLEQIPNNLKYKCVEMDAIDFSALSGIYNKIVIKELIHHINDLELFDNRKENFQWTLKKVSAAHIVAHTNPPIEDPMLVSCAAKEFFPELTWVNCK